MAHIQFSDLAEADVSAMMKILGGLRPPDLRIEPDGTPYLYRWHVIPRNEAGANVYLHLQVASDPERPLHDHPWDNQSVILAGGYVERMVRVMPWGRIEEPRRHVGQVVSRKAEEAHRLILPAEIPYTLTLFTTGPVRREWGFWINDHRGVPTWRSHNACIINTTDGRSIFRRPEDLG